MRPTSNTPRSKADPPPSKHDKKIAQRANDFMGVFENFGFSKAGHIACLIHLLDPDAVKLGKGPSTQNFNDKFVLFCNELDLALGKSKKDENKNELKTALIRLIAESGLPQADQTDFQKVLHNSSKLVVITWLRELRKKIDPPKMISRPQSQIITPLQTTTTTTASPMVTTATAAVFRASHSYQSMPTPQQASTVNMMPGHSIPMYVYQMQQPGPYPPTNYESAPSFTPVPMAMWNQDQVEPYPGTTNWPQQQQQQQHFYSPQQNGDPWNSGS